MVTVDALGFTLEDLIGAIADGDIRSQTHPEFPELSIFNYTEDVQFRNKWNKITMACRGLILNTETGEIVARPWEKFFNFGQRDLEIDFYAPVEVTDKMDGSLGILYREPGQYRNLCIATRGSFASDQAEHASEILATKYNGGKEFFDYGVDNHTFLFEIIYPDNRIVCNYGDMDDLVLLGAVHKERGWYIGPSEAASLLNWTGPVTKVFDYPTFADAISAPDRKGAEGYVIRSGSKIVKLKQADYVELHRIVTNLSPKTIWEMLGRGRMISEICAEIPDEFHDYVQTIGNELLEQASGITHEAMVAHSTIISQLPFGHSRRQFAEKAIKTPYAKYLFLLLDGKNIREVVWANIKPRGDIKSLVTDNG